MTMIDASRESSVEVVVTNYKRPENVEQILSAFRQQTYPCKLTICECAADEMFRLRKDVTELADEVYQFRENFGGLNRYVPFLGYRCDFTYFHDDDMLPGKNLLMHFVSFMKSEPRVVLLGQKGRLVRNRYRPNDVPRDKKVLTKVDMIVRGYFARTSVLLNLAMFINHLGFIPREDDMALACSVRAFRSGMIAITPDSGDPDELMNKIELPAPFATCAHPSHIRMRSRFWKQASAVADSLCEELETGDIDQILELP